MESSRNKKREYVLSALDRFEQHLTRYAARMLHGDFDRAADMVQFTFMKLCEQKTHREENQLKAWLFTVCRNRIIDDTRKNGRVHSATPEQLDLSSREYDDPVQEAENQENLKRLKKQIETMSDQDRELIDLWSHGFKHTEIATITSRKPGTVRVQLHRAIGSLKEKMGEAEAGRSRLLK